MEEELQCTYATTFHNDILNEASDLISHNIEALCLEIRKPKSKPVLVST